VVLNYGKIKTGGVMIANLAESLPRYNYIFSGFP